jgi:hypothetical protein
MRSTATCYWQVCALRSIVLQALWLTFLPRTYLKIPHGREAARAVYPRQCVRNAAHEEF